MNKKTLVIGASENPQRYSYLVINRLRAKGNEVVAIGQKAGKLGDVEITKEKLAFTNVDTVTLYVNPTIQQQYYDYILSLNPRRIVFNPGAENLEFEQLAQANGIEVLEACTLVLLSTGQY
jgi:predicted CoA-binding protein